MGFSKKLLLGKDRDEKSLIPSMVLGLVFWLFGLVTWVKRPFLREARYLFWLNWLIKDGGKLSAGSGANMVEAKETFRVEHSKTCSFYGCKDHKKCL